MFGWCCVVCFAWLLFVLSSFVCFVSAWWIRGIADEVSIASFCKAVTGTAVMARSANEEKKKRTEEENRGAEQSGRGEQTRRGEQEQSRGGEQRRSRTDEESRGGEQNRGEQRKGSEVAQISR